MRLFDWLKPSRRPVELTRDYVNINDSALAQMLKDGTGVVLDKGQQVVQASKCIEAHRIAESFRKYPEDWAWRVKGYTVVHVPTGFILWVGNEDWGLRQDGGADKSKFSKDEQAIIWPAAKAWIERFKIGFNGRLPKVRIRRERGLWQCVADGHPWTGAGNSPAHAYRSWAQAVSVEQRRANPKQKLHVWSEPL